LIYPAPLDENGNPYYVPIVVKNKDTLVGYLDGVAYTQMISDMIFKSLKIPISINGFDLNLDSSKFNDVLPDGTRAGDLSDSELKNIINSKIKDKQDFEDSRNTNPENNENILDPTFLSIDCTNCGGYYAFKTVDEIPKENFSCGICGRVLIQYTNLDDSEYKYDEKHN